MYAKYSIFNHSSLRLQYVLCIYCRLWTDVFGLFVFFDKIANLCRSFVIEHHMHQETEFS